MNSTTNKSKILASFQARIDAGQAIIGAGAGGLQKLMTSRLHKDAGLLMTSKPGIGLSAKSIEAGGGDLIIVYNSGRFRMAGHGSLAGLMPYSNANNVVVDMAPEILSVVKNTPVIAGVCGTDPFISDPTKFFEKLQNLGFDGIQNFPTVGLIDGQFRASLEETGMGYGKEVEMIRQAARLGLLTTPYVFNADESRRMTEAGADIIVAHMGLTTSGTIGAKSAKTLDDCVTTIAEIRDAATTVRKDVIILFHGGPIVTPADAASILGRVSGVHGFYGASSIERLPVESAIKDITQEFKRIHIGHE